MRLVGYLKKNISNIFDRFYPSCKTPDPASPSCLHSSAGELAGSAFSKFSSSSDVRGVCVSVCNCK